MPELSCLLDALLSDNILPELPCSLLGLHSTWRDSGALGKDIGLDNARMQNRHDDALVFQVDRQAFADGIDCRLGCAISIMSACAIIAHGSNAA